MNKKRRLKEWKRAAALMLCSIILLGGCGRSDSLPEDRQWSAESVDAATVGQSRLDMIDPKAYSDVTDLELEPGTLISMILKTSGNDSYWSQVKAGAEQAQKDLNEALGYTGDDQIKVQISGPSQAEDAEDQINLLDEELDRNPSAIVISLIDAEACGVQFDLASENGIPIVTLDSGSAYEGIMTTCSTDNEAAAVKAAQEMSAMIDEKGGIALIVHDSISETAQLRESAFREEIKKNHPDVKIVDVIYGNELDKYKKQIADERNRMTEESEAVQPESIEDGEVIQWLLQKHPNLKGIFASNDNMSKLLCSDTDDAEKIKEMVVVSFDAGKTQLDNMENDLIDGLIVQNPYGMGYASVTAAARTILGEGNESVVDTGYAWVTKDNMTGQEIKNLLYE